LAVLPPGSWNTIIALLAPGTCTSTPQFVPSGPVNGLICLAIFSLVRCQRQRMERLPSNEPCVQFVPVLHARLAELPAKENLASIEQTTKIHETGVHSFADDAQLVQLGDVTLD